MRLSRRERESALPRLIILFFVLLLNSTQAHAECPKGAEEACYFAKSMHQESIPHLPIQLSKNLYIRQLMAIDNHMDWYVMLNYDKQYLLKEYEKVDAGLPEAKKALEMIANNFLCSNEMIAPLFSKGLTVTIHYQFIDGESLVSFQVNECGR